jgi:hypothetical protein
LSTRLIYLAKRQIDGALDKGTGVNRTMGSTRPQGRQESWGQLDHREDRNHGIDSNDGVNRKWGQPGIFTSAVPFVLRQLFFAHGGIVKVVTTWTFSRSYAFTGSCPIAASGDIVDLVAVAGLAMMLAFMYIRQGVYHLHRCLGYSSVAYHRRCIACFDKCGREGDTDTRRQGQQGTF